ncbi:TRAP transporter substrate-binding protein DctP [Uliginosibacterium sp. 31-16]|uniref:TRAP transporter substrate-binding protein DctP n=1 Tax=Uliginosibacterium sp. 31-16 TaxID=3068315 RepID=UPI00273F33CF|nr:TRAP transporter substrate-binding protein DctP [Uliginosibacterium sp. 31-16]MDP5239657.1 TRAP transporter substrate-binding protein DctP [Uliginosibacterium sp. 31-16]
MNAYRTLRGLASAGVLLVLLVGVLGFSGASPALMSALAIAAALILGYAAYLAQRSFLAPLQQLAEDLGRSAGQHDFAAPAALAGDGEAARLSGLHRELVGFVATSLGELHENAERLLEIAEEAGVASRRVTRNSRLQSEAASNMAAAVEEMSVSISMAAEQVATAREHTGQSAEIARDSATDILATVDGITRVSGFVTEATGHIRSLSDDCDSIAGMAGMIREIADQTNLLALNAAIEAARAGEQGRGFAVVADEVRKLAERTTHATQEIGSLVQRMLQHAHHAVDGMAQTGKAVDEGVVSAQRAGNSMQRIQHECSSAASLVAEIASLIQEQREASGAVARNIEQVAQMSEQNSLATNSTTDALTRLSTQGRQIGDVVGRFNLGSAGGGRIVLRLADIHGTDHPAVRAEQVIAELLQERSNGRITLKVHAEGALGTEKEVSEQIRAGNIDMMRVNMSSLNKDCPLTVVPTLPFLFRDIEHLHKAMDGAPGDSILAACEAAGLIGLAFYDSGARSIYATKPVRSLADMHEMKLRVMQSDLWVAVARAMGAIATPMPMDEIIAGFKTGLIDGAENNIPTFDSYKQYEAFKYFSHTEHAMVPEIIVFSKARWQKLSAEDQQLIRAAARDSVPRMRGYWQEREQSARKRAMDAGTQFITDVDKAAFQRAMPKVYAQFVTSPEQKALLRAIQELH